MLSEKEFSRLQPFLHWKEARQRLILYFIADGYTVGELVAMRSFALKELKLPVEMSVYRDQASAEGTFEMAFTYPGGKIIPHTFYYRLIRVAAEKVLGRPMSQEQFRKYIRTGQKTS